MKRVKWFITILVINLFTGVSFAAQAELILKVALPDARFWLPGDFVADFEAAHPGVTLEIILPADNLSFLPLTADEKDINNHLSAFAAYAASADVLFVDTDRLTQPIIDVGMVLDLAPLIQIDPDPPQMFPGMDTTFADEGRVYALPLAAEMQVIRFNADILDAAGIPHPDPTWTLDDFASAFEGLPDDIPIISPRDLNTLISALAINEDDFLEAFYTVEFVESQYSLAQYANALSVSANNPPVFELINLSPAISTTETPYALAPMPAGIRVGTGLAVSTGTAQPQLAYELAESLTELDVHAAFFSGFHPSWLSTESDTYSEQELTFIRQSFDSALSFPALMQFPLVEAGAAQIIESGGIAAVVSRFYEQVKQVQAQVALEQREIPIVVGESVPLVSGEASRTLVFVAYSLNFEANQSLWEELRQQFIEENDDIDEVVLLTHDPEDKDVIEDCHYNGLYDLPHPWVSGLDLNPLLETDPNFDESDFLPGLLDWISEDGELGVYPLVIMPTMLWIDAAKFEAVGLPVPEMGWHINEFKAALDVFAAETDQPAIFLWDYITYTDLMMLVAAETEPMFEYAEPFAISHLDNPVVIDTFMHYIELYRQDVVRMPNNTVMEMPGFITLYDELVPMYASRAGYWTRAGMRETSYTPITYPRSDEFIPLRAQFGGASIPEDSSNPEACFRWIQMMGQHPEIFDSMPVRFSQLDDPVLATAQGEDMATFYQAYAEALRDSQVQLIDWPPFGGQLYFMLHEAFHFDDTIDIEQELLNWHEKYTVFYTCALNNNARRGSEEAQSCAQEAGIG